MIYLSGNAAGYLSPLQARPPFYLAPDPAPGVSDHALDLVDLTVLAQGAVQYPLYPRVGNPG